MKGILAGNSQESSASPGGYWGDEQALATEAYLGIEIPGAGEDEHVTRT